MKALRLIVAAVLAGTMLCGCFTYDARRNKKHWDMMRKDFENIHGDVLMMMGLDEETQLDRSLR